MTPFWFGSDVPCEIGLKESVDSFKEPREVMNFTQFSLEYIDQEERLSSSGVHEPSFGGHPTLEERERSFYAVNQTLHCGFVRGPAASSSTGFDIDAKDKAYMNGCKVAVSSCIFGSSDFLRRPTSRKVNVLLLIELLCSSFCKIIKCFGKIVFWSLL